MQTCPLTFFLFAGMFVSLFSLAYLISPRFCHRFVGYLEEEAVRTYTHCLEVITKHTLSPLKHTHTKLPVCIHNVLVNFNCVMDQMT